MIKFTIEEILSDVFDLEMREDRLQVEIWRVTDEAVVALHRLLSKVIETHGYYNETST